MDRLRALLRGDAHGDDGIGSADDVYPLHFLDHTTASGTIMAWTMRFNDMLDPDMLHTSLAKVLDRGDWRKLGGRLRKKKDSRYQLHVPPVFTQERPALTFTKGMLDVPIDQHPLGRQVPRQTDQPSIQADTETLRSLHLPAGAPTTFREYVEKGLPPISLHVAGFSDATIVTVTWVHYLMDAAGLGALLRAWTLSMHGKTSDIPDLEGARHDILERVNDPVYDEGAEQSLLAEQRLSLFDSVLFALHFVWDMLFGPKMLPRTVFLPKTAIEKLRRQAEHDLGSLVVERTGKAPGAKEEVRGQISRGDILLSWIVRIVASAMPTPRPITALSAIDLRGRLPGGTCHTSGTSPVLVQNLTLAAMTPLSAAEAATCTLGEIALANRRRLMDQLTGAQVVANLRLLLRGKPLDLSGMMILGESNSLLVTFTNWAKNQYCRIVDFGPAVVRSGDTSAARKNPPGTILNHYPSMVNRAPVFRQVVYVLGTDHEDNYWFSVLLDARTLSRMEESMRMLSKG